jgi:hypothetical protein
MKPLQIGSPEQVTRFREHYSTFFANSHTLNDAFSVAFDRSFTARTPIDAIIFFLGSRCMEDFREIMLLAANGFGWGATAHLRGMFERVVTTAYLHEHPETVEDFIDYDYVRRWKVALAIERTIGLDPEDQEGKENLRQNFERVRDRFLVPHCPKCPERRLNHTWSRLDVVAMTSQISKFKQIKNAVVPAYYMPLAQAHSTLESVILRIGTRDGVFGIDPELAEREARRTFQYAHLLALNAIVVQHEHFQLEALATPLEACFSHFREAWPPRTPTA